MEKKPTKMGAPKTAMEPPMYVGVTKTCPFCSSSDAEFKFLHNKNIEQPRYKCLGCNKLFTHNPNSCRKKHPDGYSKTATKRSGSCDNNDNATVSELPENIATISCLNPRCGKVGTSKFLFNNGKLTQPRYKCGSCTLSFIHGGRLSSMRNLDQGNTKMQVQLLSRRRGEEVDSSDEDSEIDEDEMACWTRWPEWTNCGT